MRWLAEYALRGRHQAIIAAAILASLPFVSWIGGAVAALVVLAKGPREGLFVAMWASLPLLDTRLLKILVAYLPLWRWSLPPRYSERQARGSWCYTGQ